MMVIDASSIRRLCASGRPRSRTADVMRIANAHMLAILAKTRLNKNAATVTPETPT